MRDEAMVFERSLAEKKQQLREPEFWYRYGTLGNFHHLSALLTGERRDLLSLIADKPVVDIGCADGDMAFFLESLGCKVQVVDYGPTNMNNLQGARLLKEALSSSVEIHDVDLDSQFSLPQKEYSLVFFLGILYHLKNPFYALEALAKSARYCLISTRITRFNKRAAELENESAQAHSTDRVNISDVPVAYLLDDYEANNDSTNYWIFSEAGFRRILARTGWRILDYITVGNTTDSDPASAAGDERAYCFAQSSRS
jgi:tRNA (mo5U34)-methyltransferase